MPTAAAQTDPAEVARFAAIGDGWWQADGAMAPLHALTPLRVGYVRDQLCRQFGRDPAGVKAVAGASHCGYRLRRRIAGGAYGAAGRHRHRRGPRGGKY